MYAQHQPRFHWWQGVSQQWWITTVLPLQEARLTIETDLRQAHLTALNRQPTTLSELAGLFFAHRQS